MVSRGCVFSSMVPLLSSALPISLRSLAFSWRLIEVVCETVSTLSKDVGDSCASSTADRNKSSTHAHLGEAPKSAGRWIFLTRCRSLTLDYQTSGVVVLFRVQLGIPEILGFYHVNETVSTLVYEIDACRRAKQCQVVYDPQFEFAPSPKSLA